MPSLQVGDMCFIVGCTPHTSGYPHNNKVVTLVNCVRFPEGHTAWATEPKLYTKWPSGAVAQVHFEARHLKPFDKDLLKDEEKQELTA